MSNMTPYEVRLEVLKLAKDIVESNRYQAVENFNSQMNRLVEMCNDNKSQAEKFMKELGMAPPPDFLDSAKVLAEAESLYTFIMKGSKGLGESVEIK